MKDNIFKRFNSVLFFNNKYVYIDVGLCNNSCDVVCVNLLGLLVF